MSLVEILQESHFVLFGKEIHCQKHHGHSFFNYFVQFLPFFPKCVTSLSDKNRVRMAYGYQSLSHFNGSVDILMLRLQYQILRME